MRNWMLHILQRPWQSALAVFALTIFPLLNVMASPLLGLITLRNGLQVGLIALVGGMAGTALIAYMELGDELSQAYALILFQLIADFGVLIVAACILRKVVSLSLALYLTALFLCATVMILQLTYGLPDASVWHGIYLEQQSLLATPATTDEGIMGFSKEQSALLFEVVARSWMAVLFLVTALKLLLARWWQSRLYYPGGFQQAFHEVRISSLTLLSLMPFLIGGFIPQAPLWVPVCGGVALALLVIIGCGVVHGLIGQRKGWGPTGLLTLFYGLFFLSLTNGFGDVWIFAVIMLTIVDSFLNLRLRFKPAE